MKKAVNDLSHLFVGFKSIRIRYKIRNLWTAECLFVGDVEGRLYIVDPNGQLYRLQRLKKKLDLT